MAGQDWRGLKCNGNKKEAGSGQRPSVIEEDVVGNHGRIRTVALRINNNNNNNNNNNDSYHICISQNLHKIILSLKKKKNLTL
jgi:hypothetical protein